MKIVKRLMIFVAVLTLLIISPQQSYAEKRIRAFNRIVIMIDSSGSFKDRRMEALEKATILIGDISNRKSKRHEGKDEVIVISLDAIPEVIWRGTREHLKAENPQYWKQRFDVRSDYQSCTDIENGFLLAAQELHKEPQATNKYLFAFTDLINEPPTGSAKKCTPVISPSLPSADFPWEAFADIETHVSWVPINQKQAWFEATQAAGIAEIFHLYSESESTVIKLTAPEKARHIMTDEERTVGKNKIFGFFKSIGNYLFYGTVIVIAIIAGGGIVTIILSRKRNDTRR